MEERSLTEFKHNQDINFFKLQNVMSINISKNLLKNVIDLKFFSKLLILDISNNQIDDLAFAEELTSLNIFNCENNKITSITSLMKCKNLEKLYLNKNNLRYQISSLKTLGSLVKLLELTIKENTVIKILH